MTKLPKSPKRKNNKLSKNSYSVTFDDMTIKADAFHDFNTVRKTVIADAVFLFAELEKIKILAESYIDDDDEDEDESSEFKKAKRSKKLKIRKDKYKHPMFG